MGMVQVDVLLQHIIDGVFNAVGIGLTAFIIFCVLWIYVKLKRWYGVASINREENDFKETISYMEETGKSLNCIQRFILSQTGVIVSGRKGGIILLYVLFLILVGVIANWCGYYIDFPYGSDDIMTIFVEKICPFIVLVGAFLCWVFSLQSLIEHVRVLPFVFCSIVLLFVSSNVIIYVIIPMLLSTPLY